MMHKNLQERSAKKQKLWQAHVQAWKESGLSQNEYCRRSELSSSQFSYWKKKHRQHQAANKAVSFVPVPAHVPELTPILTSDDSGVTIFLGSDIRIGLNNNFSSATLSKVVTELRRQP